MSDYPRRLIEVNLPIKAISAHARREKSIPHGHISTLHIWWARRPLAACRAVLCAALWLDPLDEHCPQGFRDVAALALNAFAEQVRSDPKLAKLCADHWTRWVRTTPASLRGDQPASWADLRYGLLDFITDFANWDASTVPAFLETARLLTHIAHLSLSNPDFQLPITDLRHPQSAIENLQSQIENLPRPLVVDPFAGGGSIPLEALRIGADAFASDLNPVAVLLNKVVLEYIPKYGNARIESKDAEGNPIIFNGLAEAIRYWGNWIKEQVEKELGEFYPKDPDGATPIAYLWARTITCEGPGCGAEVPLMRSLWLAKKGERSVALRLDEEAVETIRKTRLHRKTATAIFFESNGGQQRGEATVPEIRLAVSDPDLDIGNVETVLEALSGVNGCYYLVAEGNRYRFGLTPNLNKLWADRRANIPKAQINERVRAEIEKVFKAGSGIERIYFPEESGQISDRAVMTMIVLAPEHTIQKEDTLWLIDEMTRQVGSSGRTFKSALLWMVAEDDAPLKEEARKLLAWEVIEEEHARKQLQLDETQERQLQEALGRSRRDMCEAVWRQYKNLVLLDKENELKTLNLGLVHSSAAESLVGLVLNRLRQMDEVVDTVSPNFLLRNWIASAEWSVRAVRDAFFATPCFPRLTNSDAIRETIARGVSGGLLGYVGKMDDKYQPFIYNQTLNPLDVEISKDLFIISKETAESYLAQSREKPVLTTVILEPSQVELSPGGKIQFRLRCLDQRDLEMKPANLVWSAEGGTMDQAGNFVAGQDEGNYQVAVIADQMSATSVVVIRHGAAPTAPQPPPTEKLTRLEWEGVIPSQKWMNFYTRVLARFATQASLKLSLRFEVTQPDGISPQKVDETRAALHDLGLDETLHTV